MTAQTLKIGALAECAVLVSLNISQWTARRFDRTASADVTSRAGASASAARVNKQLIERNDMAEIFSAVSKARETHDRMTLPWGMRGMSILNAAAYLDYCNAMQPIQSQFEAAAAKFCATYPQLRDDAAKALGSLFKAEDYPAPEHIEKRFAFGVQFLPVPSAGDFRVDIPNEAMAEMREQVERSAREASEAAVKSVFSRVKDVLSTMSTKLAEYQPATKDTKAVGIFRDSLVGNVRELADTLPALNVFGDPIIADLARQLRDVSRLDADQLRETDALRSAAAKEAARIADLASSFL